jgi:hypothetical protein
MQVFAECPKFGTRQRFLHSANHVFPAVSSNWAGAAGEHGFRFLSWSFLGPAIIVTRGDPGTRASASYLWHEQGFGGPILSTEIRASSIHDGHK